MLLIGRTIQLRNIQIRDSKFVTSLRKRASVSRYLNNPPINVDHQIKWTKENEVKDLQLIDIGIYPLLPDEWGLGKGALKAIHYMAIGIPVVATDFGTTSLVVKDQENGFLVKSEEEWVEALEILIRDRKKRKVFGEKGREIFELNYSTNIVKEQYLSILKGL